MKNAIFFLLSVFSPFLANACMVDCERNKSLDKNIFIGEGRVVGYKGSFSQPDVKNAFGCLVVSDIFLINPAVAANQLYISQFVPDMNCSKDGYDQETLSELYPINQIISFVGYL